jgi:hypothetical protein
MVRVLGWYSAVPVALVVGTAVLLTSPYLALVVFLGLVLGVLAALAWAVVATSRVLVQALSRGWPRRGSAGREPMPADLELTPPDNRSDRRVRGGKVEWP